MGGYPGESIIGQGNDITLRCSSHQMECAAEFVPVGKQTMCALRCEVPENIFFILSTKNCPHSHMANHGAGNRWRQLLGGVMTATTVCIEFSFAYVRLSRAFSFHCRFSVRAGRFRRGGGLS